LAPPPQPPTPNPQSPIPIYKNILIKNINYFEAYTKLLLKKLIT